MENIEATPPAADATQPQVNAAALNELGELLNMRADDVMPVHVIAFIKSLSIPSTALNKLQAAMDHIRRCSQNGHAPSQDFIRLHGDISVSP